MTGPVAVLDVGKTNVKVILFDADGHVLAERSRRNASRPADAETPYLHLDTTGIWAFLLEALKALGGLYPIEALSISAHGAAGVLVNESGEALPPMDYEFEGYEVDAADYAAVRPAFAETLSPSLPRGLNLGRQVFYQFRHLPERAARATSLLAYAQYWAWRLTGVTATEVTSFGAHTDLWNPSEKRLSSLVERMGWTNLFPPVRNAWDRLGPLRPEIAAATGLSRDVEVICGGHDSNAALVPHLLSQTEPFTLVSTGTWVIVMAVGGRADLDEAFDMLANVDVRGEPVPSARFMGGREFSVLAGEAPTDPTDADIAACVAAGTFALPAFSDQGGPFAGRKGRIVGPAPQSPAARAALATLYAALMTDLLIERLQGPGDIIVEGGLTRAPAFAGVMAALALARLVRVAPSSAGAAEGAMRLARWGSSTPVEASRRVEAWKVPDLAAYRAKWRAALRD